MATQRHGVESTTRRLAQQEAATRGGMSHGFYRLAAVMERALTAEPSYPYLVRCAQLDFGLDRDAAQTMTLEYILGLWVREYGLDAAHIQSYGDDG